jgi:hypothetical protein
VLYSYSFLSIAISMQVKFYSLCRGSIIGQS